MPGFEITIKEPEIYCLSVDADSEEDARSIAEDVVEITRDIKDEYHNDSEVEISIYED